MTICVDVGNTITTFGILVDGEVRAFWRIATRERTSDEYSMIISGMMSRSRVEMADVDKAGVCSVAPSETEEVRRALGVLLGVPAAWLRSEAEAGRVPYLRAGRRLLFNLAEVERSLLERARREQGDDGADERDAGGTT